MYKSSVVCTCECVYTSVQSKETDKISQRGKEKRKKHREERKGENTYIGQCK